MALYQHPSQALPARLNSISWISNCQLCITQPWYNCCNAAAKLRKTTESVILLKWICFVWRSFISGQDRQTVNPTIVALGIAQKKYLEVETFSGPKSQRFSFVFNAKNLGKSVSRWYQPTTWASKGPEAFRFMPRLPGDQLESFWHLKKERNDMKQNKQPRTWSASFC